MPDQLLSLLDSFKQELTDMQATHQEVVSGVPGAWRGEAAAAYTKALQALNEDLLYQISHLAVLEEKISGYVQSMMALSV